MRRSPSKIPISFPQIIWPNDIEILFYRSKMADKMTPSYRSNNHRSRDFTMSDRILEEQVSKIVSEFWICLWILLPDIMQSNNMVTTVEILGKFHFLPYLSFIHFDKIRAGFCLIFMRGLIHLWNKCRYRHWARHFTKHFTLVIFVTLRVLLHAQKLFDTALNWNYLIISKILVDSYITVTIIKSTRRHVCHCQSLDWQFGR